MTQRNCAIQNRFEAYAKLQKHKWNIANEKRAEKCAQSTHFLFYEMHQYSIRFFGEALRASG
jgi:hypothetical protein